MSGMTNMELMKWRICELDSAQFSKLLDAMEITRISFKSDKLCKNVSNEMRKLINYIVQDCENEYNVKQVARTVESGKIAPSIMRQGFPIWRNNFNDWLNSEAKQEQKGKS